MKLDRAISGRIRDMLAKDKVKVGEGFYAALKGDLERLLTDYFELKGGAEVVVDMLENGDFVVRVNAAARRIKQFDTTYDVPRSR